MAYEPRNNNSRSQGRNSSGPGPRRGNKNHSERHGFRKNNERENERRYSRDGQRSSYGRDGERHEFGRKHDGERRDNNRRGGRYGNRRDDRGNRRGYGREERDSRPPQRARVPEPPVPEGVEASELDSSARSGLRALGRQNAENVARHLIMTQRLLDTDPETAYQHARYAASHAGRIAVVREAAGISAYLSGHYTEALRDIRAARRLAGVPELHRAIEVDCERALGRLEQALQVAEESDSKRLDEIERAELAMVLSGVRHEMGQTELGLIVVEDAIRSRPRDKETLRRLHSVRADRLEELGRNAEAEAIRDRIGPDVEENIDPAVEVYDIEEESAPELAAEQEMQTESTDTTQPEGNPTLSFEEQVQQEMAELLDEEE